MPAETGVMLDWMPFVTTDCFLLSKIFFFIHFKVSPLMPYFKDGGFGALLSVQLN